MIERCLLGFDDFILTWLFKISYPKSFRKIFGLWLDSDLIVNPFFKSDSDWINYPKKLDWATAWIETYLLIYSQPCSSFLWAYFLSPKWKLHLCWPLPLTFLFYSNQIKFKYRKNVIKLKSASLIQVLYLMKKIYTET